MRYSTPKSYGPTAAEIEQLSRQYFGPQKPREIDYLTYLIDEFELNSWQAGAFPDMVTALRSGRISWLSEKQKAALVKAIKEYDCYNDDVVKGYLTRGFADNNDKAGTKPTMQQPERSGKDAAANQESRSFDDMDDDIPF